MGTLDNMDNVRHNPNPGKIKVALKKFIKEDAIVEIELMNKEKYLFIPFNISRERFLGFPLDVVAGAWLTKKHKVRKAIGFFLPLIKSVKKIKSD